MKTLYLIRHAKSSWSFVQLDDYARPLGLRGRRDVKKMAQFAARHIAAPQLLITSPASRAFYTALFMADGWEYPEEKISLEPALYEADEEEMLEVIRQNGGDEQILAIVGHNPGMTDLANELSGESIENIPTGSICAIEFDIEVWEEIGSKKGIKKFLYLPKNL